MGEHITDGGLRLPLPVQTRHAAGEQLPGLFHLRFLRVDFANACLDLRAVFPPQIQIPARGQAKSTVGVPRPCSARRWIGEGKRTHQPFS
ncbi:hypothetical protein D3C87_1918030 [compost metagenome]